MLLGPGEYNVDRELSPKHFYMGQKLRPISKKDQN